MSTCDGNRDEVVESRRVPRRVRHVGAVVGTEGDCATAYCEMCSWIAWSEERGTPGLREAHQLLAEHFEEAHPL